MFFGLGSDGTVGANKASVKIIGEHTDRYAQGYFVYDSKKSGSVTVSHLRFGPEPIRSTYLIDRRRLRRPATSSACSSRTKVLDHAKAGATLLLNSPFGPDEVWDQLPGRRAAAAHRQGHRAVGHRRLPGGPRDGHGQPHQHRHAAVLLPAGRRAARRARPSATSRTSVETTYGTRGRALVERNFAAIDRALAGAAPRRGPDRGQQRPADGRRRPRRRARLRASRSPRVLLAGDGDLLPVSALPVDGTFPSGTAKYEKRAIAKEIPIWDPDICIDCGKCAIVCPHATIRMKVFAPDAVADGPGRASDARRSGPRTWPATGSPSRSPPTTAPAAASASTCARPSRKTEVAAQGHQHGARLASTEDLERGRWDFFLVDPAARPRRCCPHDSVKGSQVLEPLFEFSGACAGCGETPYLKLVSQLFGDRMIVANATGCSSIYGGNLPDHALDGRTRRPGTGLEQLAVRGQRRVRPGHAARPRRPGTSLARLLLPAPGPRASATRWSTAILDSRRRTTEPAIAASSASGWPTCRHAPRRGRGDGPADAAPACRRWPTPWCASGVWIIGGDGWAYDIGFGGLDHVLSSGRNVNILVLDTEVYSNTGGQASKATPRGAVAKFAAARQGRPARRTWARSPAPTATSTWPRSPWAPTTLQATKALLEADAWPGPRWSSPTRTCIAHGIDMSKSMSHQKDAVRSRATGRSTGSIRPRIDDGHPFKLDSQPPSIPVATSSPPRRASPSWRAPTPNGPRELAALACRPTSTSAGATTSSSPAWSAPSPTCLADVQPDVETDAGYRTGPGAQP